MGVCVMIIDMNDLWNIMHMIGGAAVACIVIALCHNKCEHWATILFTSLSGFVANLFWELIVDVYGWVTIFGRAGTPDIKDIIRGGIASIAIAVLYMLAFRKKYGSWRY